MKIIAIYRPPNKSKIKFLKELKVLLNKNNSKKCVVIGDINIDLNKKDNITEKYLRILAEAGMKNLTKSKTRVAIKGNKLVSSTIDHIFIRHNKGNSKGGTLKRMIADHYPIWVEFKMKHKTSNETKDKWKKIDRKKIKEALDKINWDTYLEIKDIEIMYQKVTDEYSNIIKNNTQIVSKREFLRVHSDQNT